MIRLYAAAGLAGLFLGVCAPEADETPPVADPATRVALSSGEAIGYTDPDTGARIWLGLPYAAAPEGEARWRAPAPRAPWLEAIEALAHAAPCPQITNTLSAEASGVKPGQLIGSEDCLALDVYAPPAAAFVEGPLPVMVWIHGGSNLWGYASQYDGAQLAADQSVIVVVIQYRLGPLGFFAHPALADGSGAPPAANFALLDQIAALEWVRDNAAAFGGDRDRVTIFGESAGGHNVAGLLASPGSAGLFHRAIIQSGSLESVALEDAQAYATTTAQSFGGARADAASLRAAPLEAVYAAYAEAGLETLPRMITDEATVPAEGLFAAIEQGAFHRVPVITGANRDEMKLFLAFDPALTRRWFGAIIRTPDPDLYDAASEYQSRVWRVLAVDQAATAMQAAGHDAVWAYRFDWDEAGDAPFMDLSRLLGAAHAMEIPFVFNHFDFFGRLDPYIFAESNTPGRTALSRSMGAYWAAFARDGDPGAAGGLDWSAWTEGGLLMRFDSPESGGPELMTGMETLEAITADLAADPRLDAEGRCLVLERLAGWRESVRALAAGAITCAP